MSNQCPGCGGFLRYDIPSGKLKCDYCDFTEDVEAYDMETAAEEHHEAVSENWAAEAASVQTGPASTETEAGVAAQTESAGSYEVTEYICPSCGAVISSTENTALDYCLYCGSFVTLDTQLSRIRKPDSIIPFSKSKEDCKKAYRRALARKLYAPKEFHKDEFLEGFKGIYIPYWSYSYDIGPGYTLRGDMEYREGDYLCNQHYWAECSGEIHAEGLNYDASSTFDDTISGRIARIDSEKVRPFHPGYLFGFFGDTADVEAEVYHEDADAAIGPALWKQATSDKRITPAHVKTPEEDKLLSQLHPKRTVRLTMLPVWFLTWRKKDKVAYSVVNGDTGEIYSEVPVDTGRYLLLSLLTAVPLFFLLNLLFTFQATSLLLITIVLSLLFISLYSTEVERIVKRTLHIDDKGYLARHADQKAENDSSYHESLLHEGVQFILDLFFRDGITGYLLLLIALVSISGFTIAGIGIIALLAPIYSIYRVHKNGKLLGEKRLAWDIYSAILALLLSVAILFMDPASDLFYYGTAILCLLAVAFSAVRVMLRYNEVITRPVPHFFDRKEGDEE